MMMKNHNSREPRSAGRGAYQWVLEAGIALIMFGSLILAIIKIGG